MRGTTLLELMVTLAVLGLLTGTAAAALGTLRRPEAARWASDVARARDSAIRTGRPVRVSGDSGYRALLLPDGRAVGPGLDPLTGEVTDAAR
jgi:prepilin-type N-terminal cleavage/methylation domain-containing protein